jgi:thioredoxin-related protein
VAAALNEFLVPVQVNVDEDKELVERFRVIWTPNINIMDSEESVFYHVEGWLPPSEYSAMLMVAHGQYFLQNNKFQDASNLFQTVWDKYPQSDFAPEALYYLGVSEFMESHQEEDLMKGWKLLQRYHPQSTWSIRSSIV